MYLPKSPEAACVPNQEPPEAVYVSTQEPRGGLCIYPRSQRLAIYLAKSPEAAFISTQEPRGCLCIYRRAQRLYIYIPKSPEAVEIETTIVVPVPLQLLSHSPSSIAASRQTQETEADCVFNLNLIDCQCI
jgi:hypothetical protein